MGIEGQGDTNSKFHMLHLCRLPLLEMARVTYPASSNFAMRVLQTVPKSTLRIEDFGAMFSCLSRCFQGSYRCTELFFGRWC